jgi:hypothetical protein
MHWAVSRCRSTLILVTACAGLARWSQSFSVPQAPDGAATVSSTDHGLGEVS